MAKKKQAKSKARTSASTVEADLSGYPAWFRNRWLQAALLFCFAFLLYANSLSNGYALDDAIVITNNEFTQQGFAGMDEILEYDTFRGFFKREGRDKLVAGGRYRPLTLLMFAFERELFGDSPFAGHLINTLLYGLTAVLLYFFLFRLLAPGRGPVAATWIALASTLIFAAHPLHTEAVANIKGRDEIMALLGALAALYALLRVVDSGKKTIWLPVAAISLLLGMLAKEHIITLLGIAPLMLYYFRKTNAGAALLRTWPLWIAAGIYLLWRGQILGWELGEPPRELMNNPFLVYENGQIVSMPFAEKYATIFYTLGKYLQLLVVPHPLTHDYYPRHIEVMSFSDPLAGASLLAHLALLGAAIYSLRKRQAWGFAIWFYLISLSIVSNIVFPVGTNMSERFLYMPSIGFCLALALRVYHLVERRKPKPAFNRLRNGLLGVGLLALVFGAKTILRNPVWENDYTLFTTDVQVSENSAKLQNSVGGQLIEQSEKPENAERKEELLQQAITHLERAAEIHPLYKYPYHLMGNAYLYLGSYQEALEQYDRALARDAGFPEAITNKGIAYIYLNQFTEAFNQFEQALAIDPQYADALRYYGIAYREAGQYFGEKRNDLATALRYLSEAEKRLPNDFETLRLLGVAYGSMLNSEQAITYFNRALEVAPSERERAIILMNLGTAWYSFDENRAAQYYQQARELDPTVFNQ